MYYVTSVVIKRKTRRFVVDAPKSFVAAAKLLAWLRDDMGQEAKLPKVSHEDMQLVVTTNRGVYEVSELKH